MNMGIICGSLLLWPHFVRHYVVQSPFGESLRSIFSSITRPFSQRSKASMGPYGGKASTQYSKRKFAKEEGFERQPSDASLELGEGIMTSTTIEVGDHPEDPEDLGSSKR